MSFVPLSPLSFCLCTTKKALDEDRYEEKGLCCFLCLPIPVCDTRTRKYVQPGDYSPMQGHATNGFAKDSGINRCCATPDCSIGYQEDIDWYRDPDHTRKDGLLSSASCVLGYQMARKLG